MNTKKNIRIKQKKNSLDRIVSSSFLALLLFLGVYMVQNMNLVFKMVDYKNSVNEIAKLEKDILDTSDSITEYKKKLSMSSESFEGLKKVPNKNFVVRKNAGTDFTILYDTKK